MHIISLSLFFFFPLLPFPFSFPKHISLVLTNLSNDSGFSYGLFLNKIILWLFPFASGAYWFSVCISSYYKSGCLCGMASLLKINLSQKFIPFHVSYIHHLLINLYIVMKKKKCFPIFLGMWQWKILLRCLQFPQTCIYKKALGETLWCILNASQEV